MSLRNPVVGSYYPNTTVMAELLAAALTTQLVKVSTELVAGFSSAAIEAFASNGVDRTIVSILMAVGSTLEPRRLYTDACQLGVPSRPSLAEALKAKFFRPSPTRATQELLQTSMEGRRLLIFVSALSCAFPVDRVLDLLRQIVSQYYRHAINPLSDDIYHGLILESVRGLSQREIQFRLESFHDAFRKVIERSQVQSGTVQLASARDRAALIMAVAALQHDGDPNSLITVTNFRGMEEICAHLVVVYPVRITVGDNEPCFIRLDAGSNQQYVDITFQYDQTHNAAILIEVRGTKFTSYCIPEPEDPNAHVEPGGIVKIGNKLAEIKAAIRVQFEDASSDWRTVAVSGLLPEILQDHRESGRTMAVSGRLPKILRGRKENSISTHRVVRLRRALLAHENPEEYCCDQHDHLVLTMFINYIELVKSLGASDLEERSQFSQSLKDARWLYDNRPQTAIDVDPTRLVLFQRLWYIAFLQAIFGSNALQLEVSSNINYQLNPLWELRPEQDTSTELPNFLGILKNHAAVTKGHTGGRHAYLLSIIQCGAFVLAPRFLAEESVGLNEATDGLETSIITMIPGRLRMKHGPVEGIYFTTRLISSPSPRPKANAIPYLPCDSAHSSTITYHYVREWPDWQADSLQYYTTEAGEFVDLVKFFHARLFLRVVTRTVGKSAKHWSSVPPDYDYQTTEKGYYSRLFDPLTDEPKTWRNYVVASYNNAAARRLAIVRAAEAGRTAILYLGEDYRTALALAERINCHTVIL